MAKYHVLRNYSGDGDAPVGDFGLHIYTKMNGNATFPTPPVTPAALQTIALAFNVAVAAVNNGTPTDTFNKKNLRTSLILALDQLATYVELTANNDPIKILSSGFNLASTSKTPLVPGATAVVNVVNVASGKLDVKVLPAANAWAFVVEYTALPSGAVKLAVFTDPHEMTLTGLTPGTMYSIRALVMGSGNQTTEFCAPIQQMAT